MALLRRGIELNPDGAALNKSTERVIDQIRAEMTEPAAARDSPQRPRSAPEQQPASAGLEHVLLARYRKLVVAVPSDCSANSLVQPPRGIFTRAERAFEKSSAAC